MQHQNVARRLSDTERNLLIKHLPSGGARRFVHEERLTRSNMIAEKLLYSCDETGTPKLERFGFSALTEDGRAVVGYVLGAFADALVAAGFLEFGLPRTSDGALKLSLRTVGYRRRHENESDASLRMQDLRVPLRDPLPEPD